LVAAGAARASAGFGAKVEATVEAAAVARNPRRESDEGTDMMTASNR
jgi:hypothetical protein